MYGESISDPYCLYLEHCFVIIKCMYDGINVYNRVNIIDINYADFPNRMVKKVKKMKNKPRENIKTSRKFFMNIKCNLIPV